MTKYGYTKFALLLLVAVVASSLTFAAITITKRSGAAQPSSATKDPRSLKEKAKRGGGKFVGNENPDRTAMYDDMAQLAAHSKLIVVATPQRNSCRLLADSKRIVTDYTVRVEEVLKGKVKHSDVLTISLPGGKVGFEDNSTAEMITPWFKKMLNNKRYILFLDKKDEEETLIPTGGAQGVFELPDNNQGVLSHSGIRDDPMRQYHKVEVQAFLDEVRQAAKN